MQRPIAQIPWGHNIALLTKLKDRDQRLWYAQKAAENGWSRPVLELQIESRLHERQGKALTNFRETLPAPDSDLAQQLLKDPYNFDFLALADDVAERDIEQGLIDRVRDFLMELGEGFAFVGNQYHLEVAGDDFYIDLLLYHTRLHRYVVVELKVDDFRPEYAGKMNFYLAAVDDLVATETDEPTVGLILCKGKKGSVVEYALRQVGTPIGVAEFRSAAALPEAMRDELPAPEEIRSRVEELPGSEGEAT